MRRLVTLIIPTALLLLLSASAFAAGATVGVDRVVDNEFVDKGQLTFYVDVADASGRAVDGLDPTAVSFFVDGKPAPGKITVRPLQATGEGTAVMLVLPAYQAFVAGEGGRKAFARAMSGARQFVRRLGQQDHIAVVTYNDEAYDLRHSFSKDPDAAAKALDDFASDLQRGEPQAHPPLPKLLGEVLPYLIKSGFKAENLPDRRMLFIVTAGHDRTVASGRERSISDKVDRLVRSARDPSFGPLRKIYTVGVHGFTERDKLAPFRSLAERTGGAYSDAEFRDDFDAVEESIVALGERILKQYVVTWEPEDWRGGKGKLRLDVDVKGSKVWHDIQRTVWKERPLPWLSIVLWVLGGILGIILLIGIIRAIIRGVSARRAAAPAPVEQPEMPSGKLRAVLYVKTGSYAGEEVYLTNQITTMGKSDACDLVFEDPRMSRRHAAVRIEDMRFEISDLKSTNGTFVDGRKIEKCFLKDGDSIRVGETELEFRLMK